MDSQTERTNGGSLRKIRTLAWLLLLCIVGRLPEDTHDRQHAVKKYLCNGGRTWLWE